MLVFGDRVREHATSELIQALHERLVRPLSHAALVTAFIEASELAQGLADAQREQRGVDGHDELADRAMMLLLELARALDRSWSGARPRIDGGALHSLEASVLPARIRTKRAEGYAYYALYPESYLAAARRVRGLHHVIGIRSIGVGLAALVAAASGAPLPTSVRPVGDPYRRELAIAPELRAAWAADRRTTFAIVDEGPGRSGSSFGAVLDLLEELDIPPDRIACFPSHLGDLGPEADARHRARWQRVSRYAVSTDELLLASGRLAAWIAELVGPLDGPLQDISGGAWRALHFADEAAWPPVIAYQERRKLLARARGRTWLARFVGLGRAGEEALSRAYALHAAGFTPEVAGLCHGFLIERWHDDARPLALHAIDRRYLIEHVGRYLGFRARRPAESGASLAELVEMVRRNVTLGASGKLATQIVAEIGPAHRLEARRRPVEIDGRLHAWEWLHTSDGRLVKADAYDHVASHDLVGGQDITWDLAGAAVELGLDHDEQRRLAAIVAEVSGREPDPELLRVMRLCYLAFQLGRAELAAGSADPADTARLRAAATHYATLLRG